ARLRTTAPERMRTLDPALDEVFEWCAGSRPPASMALVTDCRAEVAVAQAEMSLDGRSTWRWVVRGDSAAAQPGEMVVLLYEVEADCELPGERRDASWSESVDVPCRTLTMRIEGAPRTNARIAPARITTASTQPRSGDLEEEVRLT